MAQYDDPLNTGENVARDIPGTSILRMLANAGRSLPQGWEQAKQMLGLAQRMPTPRDAMGRPLPINPATGQPFTQQEVMAQQAQQAQQAGGRLY